MKNQTKFRFNYNHNHNCISLIDLETGRSQLLGDEEVEKLQHELSEALDKKKSWDDWNESNTQTIISMGR